MKKQQLERERDSERGTYFSGEPESLKTGFGHREQELFNGGKRGNEKSKWEPKSNLGLGEFIIRDYFGFQKKKKR